MTHDLLTRTFLSQDLTFDSLLVRRRIVVVDDHPAITHALKNLLEKDSMLQVVDSAVDGVDGLEKHRLHRPDLLIVDITMPRLNGIDLVKRLRAHSDPVSLLVFSAQKGEAVASAARSAGADGFLSKLSGEREIVHAVRAVLSGRNLFPALIETTAPETGAHELTRMLSKRELSLLRYLAEGLSNKEIANTFCLSEKTISTHKCNILGKLGLTNIVDLANFVQSNHLID